MSSDRSKAMHILCQRIFHDECESFHVLTIASCRRVLVIMHSQISFIPFLQGLRYFLQITRVLVLVMVFTTIYFLNPPQQLPCEWEWRCGWISTVLAWALVMRYLRTWVYVMWVGVAMWLDLHRASVGIGHAVPQNVSLCHVSGSGDVAGSPPC